MYQVKDSTLNLIASEERFSPTPYLDDYAPSPRVEYSIGYGHQIQPWENLTLITKAQALDILKADLQPRIDALNRVLPPGLSQGQIDALVDYTMSFGPGGISQAKLFKLVAENAPLDKIKSWWLTSYITSGGIVLPGLVARREREYNQFISGLTSSQGKWLLALKILAGGFFLFLLYLLIKNNSE